VRTQDAIIRNLQVMGEAVNHIPPLRDKVRRAFSP
jgi:uncharacterized protein with HEPN domain